MSTRAPWWLSHGLRGSLEERTRGAPTSLRQKGKAVEFKFFSLSDFPELAGVQFVKLYMQVNDKKIEEGHNDQYYVYYYGESQGYWGMANREFAICWAKGLLAKNKPPPAENEWGPIMP